eukprot:scaffold20929_cov30-Tisochrysis_lutea.AAC.4
MDAVFSRPVDVLAAAHLRTREGRQGGGWERGGGWQRSGSARPTGAEAVRTCIHCADPGESRVRMSLLSESDAAAGPPTNELSGSELHSFSQPPTHGMTQRPGDEEAYSCDPPRSSSCRTSESAS